MHQSARSETYRGLAQCYGRPVRNTIEVVKGIEQHLSLIGSGALTHTSPMRRELQSPADLYRLEVDFAKLFVGPYSLLAPPYGSVYLEDGRKMMGESTLNAAQLYSDAGLEISAGFQDAPDHISAELEFMYYLTFRQVESLRNMDEESFHTNLSRQRTFLGFHLGAWIREFAANVELHSETGFYRGLAMATERFIREDLEMLTEFPNTGFKLSEI